MKFNSRVHILGAKISFIIEQRKLPGWITTLSIYI